MKAAGKKPAPRWTEYLTAQMLEVDSRLANWARWAYERIGGPRHCGSIEHRYLPARDDDRGERQERESSEGIDALDAMLVEACVVVLPLTSRERAFLLSYYIGRHHWRQTCRMLRIHPDVFPSAHARTIVVVAGALHSAREGASPAARGGAIVAPSDSSSADYGAYRLPAWGSVSR